MRYLKAIVLLIIPSIFSSCKTTDNSQLSASSVLAEKNFKVEKIESTSDVATEKKEYLIRVKPEADYLAGYTLTPANPNVLDEVVSYEVAEDTCKNLKYGNLIGWKLPTVDQWKNLLEMDFYHVGTGNDVLNTNGNFWINSSKAKINKLAVRMYGNGIFDYELYVGAEVEIFSLAQRKSKEAGVKSMKSEAVHMGFYAQADLAENEYKKIAKYDSYKPTEKTENGMERLGAYLYYKTKFLCIRDPN